MKRTIIPNVPKDSKPVTAWNTATAPKTDRGIPDALRHFDQLPDTAFVRLPTVCGLFGQSRSSIWRAVKLQTIPAPRKFSARVTCWQVGELRRALLAI